jgi:uncharacterized protein YdeI (YjbR/CyaY-like superfamily)
MPPMSARGPSSDRDVLEFRTATEWERWLERNHDSAQEAWLRLHNKNAADQGVSYAEAVESALCFGWIDSQARGFDDVSRLQRFSPRRARSPWSASNVERVTRLIAAGRMHPAGLSQVEAAKAEGRWPSS